MRVWTVILQIAIDFQKNLKCGNGMISFQTEQYNFGDSIENSFGEEKDQIRAGNWMSNSLYFWQILDPILGSESKLTIYRDSQTNDVTS